MRAHQTRKYVSLVFAIVSIVSTWLVCFSLSYDHDRQQMTVDLPHWAIIPVTLTYGCSIPVLYYSNSCHEYQDYFVAAGVLTSVLSGLLASSGRLDILVQYIAWGLLASLLVSAVFHQIRRTLKNDDEQVEYADMKNIPGDEGSTIGWGSYSGGYLQRREKVSPI